MDSEALYLICAVGGEDSGGVMTERRFTLIDVMNGMFDLSLHTILTPPCFTFFWGIIQMCNRFKPRFKNPFTLTLAQATAAGGGISRQAIWDKQQRLNKVTVDGRSLITITAGSRKDNKAAKYNINYKLIVPEKPVVIESTEIPSIIIDELRTICGRSGQEPSKIIDDLLTFLRSDQIRGDQIPPTPLNDATTEEGTRETEEAGGGWSPPEDSEEDWIEYITDALKPLDVKYPKLDIVEKSKWLVSNNDLVLIEECYQEFMQIPMVKIGNRVAFFMKMVEDRGGEVIR